MTKHRRWARSEQGQALVEFSLTILIFLALLLGVLDLGRGIFTYNNVSQAARDIARATSVHPGSPLGSSPETQAEIDRHEAYTPITSVDFSCAEIDGSPESGSCLPGKWVRVEVTATYSPVSPILNLLDMDLTSSSSIQIP